jgi:hypothetical protein
VVLVRHAQDQVTSFADDFDWAEASVTLCHHSGTPPVEHNKVAVYEGQIDTPTGRLWVGDADGDVQMSGLTPTSSLRVLYPANDMHSPDQVWVDVWPA